MLALVRAQAARKPRAVVPAQIVTTDVVLVNNLSCSFMKGITVGSVAVGSHRDLREHAGGAGSRRSARCRGPDPRESRSGGRREPDLGICAAKGEQVDLLQTILLTAQKYPEDRYLWDTSVELADAAKLMQLPPLLEQGQALDLLGGFANLSSSELRNLGTAYQAIRNAIQGWRLRPDSADPQLNDLYDSLSAANPPSVLIHVDRKPLRFR